MAEIFVTYSRHDLPKVKPLIDGLMRAGFSVWYDIEIAAGDVWHDRILKEIEQASFVIVLWTPFSVRSEWVRAEAQLALDRSKLIPIILEPVEIPLGFRGIQHLDMSSWDGSQGSDEFRHLTEVISKSTSVGRSSDRQPDTPGARIDVSPDRPYMQVPGSNKIKVFIAHASADKPRLRPVLQILIDRGFGLWVDKPQRIGLPLLYESKILRDRIHYGEDWKEGIRIAIHKADAVLAFWSRDAVNGRREQFHYEVYQGMMGRKLSQCRIDSVEYAEIGMPYTFDHIADLSDFSDVEYHPELDGLMQDIGRKFRRSWLSWWPSGTG